MSASERLQKDYLTCTLCSKPYTHPKNLPCLHNFCKACLSAYLEDAMSGGRHSTFSCPDCRKKIYVPDPSKPISRWAAQFPTNFTLSGMIEAIAEETAGKGRGIALVKEAKERRGVPDAQGSPRSSPTHLKRDGSKDGQGEGSGHSQISSEVKDVKTKLTAMEDYLEKEKTDIDHKLDGLSSKMENEKQKVEKSFQKIYDLMEGRKAQFLEELSTNFSEEQDKMLQTKQNFANDLESLMSCSELLSTIEAKPVSDVAVMDMLDAITAQTREIEARQTQPLSHTIKFEQTLEAGRSVLTLLQDLGRVTITTSNDATRESDSREGSHGGSLRSSAQNSFDSSDGAARPSRILAKPRFITAVSTKQSDGKYFQIYDITVMPSGIIVMTAYNDNYVLAARKVGNTYKIFSHLRLDSQPKCIETIAPFFVAVVGSASCVYLIVVDDKLALKKTIQTGKNYTGISSYSESSLILSCQKPASIDFVGLNGFISETIDRDHTTGNILLRFPQFMTSSKDGVIFVTDITKNPKLLCLNNAGKVKFQFPPEGSGGLEAPQGVCCDSQGHVYVVDRGAHKVILLTPSGEKVKDILTAEEGITDPCAIAVDDKDNIYVTNEFNEVLIFQIK